MIEDVVANESTPESQTTGQESGAQTDDLDAILSEIDEDFDKATEETPDEDEVKQLKATVDALVQKDTDAAINTAVSSVQGDLHNLEVNLPDRAVKALLNQMAVEDKRIQEAFRDRENNPGRWKKILNAAAKSIAKDFSEQPDQQLTNDRKYATAIRGKQTAEDDSPDFSKMTDHEYNDWKLKH